MKQYEPVLIVYYKLRSIIGEKDDRSILEDMVKYGEEFVGKSTKSKVNNNLKIGLGSQN
jgi:hypothetical protein